MKRRIRSALMRLTTGSPRLYQEVKWLESYLRYRTGRLHDREFAMLRQILPPPDLVVDVGGNYGQSLFALRLIVPGARIVSFEPDPTSCRYLRRTARRLGRCEVQGLALGAAAGQATLRIPERGGTGFSQAASIAEGPVAAPEVERLFGRDYTLKAVTVEVAPLDRFGLDPDLIKIDVQGAEPDVLAGAAETLARARPVLFIERGSTEARCKEILGGLGYRWPESRPTPDPESRAPINFLAIPEEKSDLLARLSGMPDRGTITSD